LGAAFSERVKLLLIDILSPPCNKSAPSRNREYDKMFRVSQNINFSEWLQAEMSKRGWSQSDLARFAELNRAVINKLLNGKSRPQPSTLGAIARALKIPIETVYRAAGLLPKNDEHDDATEELVYILKSIRSPQRKATAIMLLKALIAEEENEQHKADKSKR
jgi:transcriptional regulator with XRE-family HTH domain